jgi:hypothetical protein
MNNAFIKLALATCCAAAAVRSSEYPTPAIREEQKIVIDGVTET